MEHKDREAVLRRNSSGNIIADMFDDVREEESEEEDEEIKRSGL